MQVFILQKQMKVVWIGDCTFTHVGRKCHCCCLALREVLPELSLFYTYEEGTAICPNQTFDKSMGLLVLGRTIHLADTFLSII